MIGCGQGASGSIIPSDLSVGGPRRHTQNANYANDDAPERGHHHDLQPLLVRLSADGLGQAAARWRISFVKLARLLPYTCFTALVVVLSIPAMAYRLQAV
jgi:hypothetical protein